MRRKKAHTRFPERLNGLRQIFADIKRHTVNASHRRADGKGTGDVPYDFIDASVDIRMMKVTTTKGYPIEAWYYVEAGTVQFIYTGEVSPGGAWYIDPDSMDVMDAYFNYEKTTLDITHEQKIQILGEPTMTAEEVIAALQ